MKKRVKQICKECGNIEYKNINWKTRIKSVSRILIYSIIGICTLVGFLALYNFIIADNLGNYNLILTMGGFRSSIGNFMNNFQSSEELSKVAFNLTKGCTDDECKAKKIYEHLKPFSSIAGEERMNPLEIWESGYGDCDELITLYMALLKELNIKSKMVCDTTHCWSRLRIDGKKILVDITLERWEEY
ncbi:MAG: transglutaminase-like domain-containing protein [Nanoarchaeota archaeon]|nr:transglutaminase-like domain-containing protein [Nanoarchaeota archaeon]